ncbi:hypothetical protein L3V82_05100 [Thiotrichales bacterium 19S3-7]|nr:hypothetical protein [Thiotrichales bacterium 19S3-7]MCF6801469.1 hypothetical protein [Thiotrichales bacterium 19S3-11]
MPNTHYTLDDDTILVKINFSNKFSQWIQLNHTDDESLEVSNIKLHLGISYNDVENYISFMVTDDVTKPFSFSGAIIDCLKSAITDRTIYGFKFFKPDENKRQAIETNKHFKHIGAIIKKIESTPNPIEKSSLTLEEQSTINFYIPNNKGTIYLSPEMLLEIKRSAMSSKRICSNNITIYLPKFMNIEAIQELCQKIENIIKDAQIEPDTLSIADLPTQYKHISLRAESITPDSDYICIADATDNELKQLTDVGKQTELYQNIKPKVHESTPLLFSPKSNTTPDQSNTVPDPCCPCVIQ